ARYFAQVSGIAAVISPDDNHQVDVLAHEFVDGILPVLSGRTDRIEMAEPVGNLVLAVAFLDRFPEHLSDFQGFTAQHSGLVGEADVLEVDFGVESRRACLLKLLEKRAGIAALDDVAAGSRSLLVI